MDERRTRQRGTIAFVRVIAICAVLAGCGSPEANPRTPEAAVPQAARPAAAAPAAGAAPALDAPRGPQLPDGVAPTAYDLTLELDPERTSFTGRVAIAIAVAAPTRVVWLHAVDLVISRAVVRAGGRDEPVSIISAGAELRGFALRDPVGPGQLSLVIDYTGRVGGVHGRGGKEEQGLFRERTGGRWYLYSQAESVFARRIAPCFDEPRWKPAWRVTVIAPRDLVARGNAPQAAERVLPDGRREVRFAEIAGLPSYLLAIAVGPFDLVDLGQLGRGRTPVRIAAAVGDGPRATVARRELGRIIDALEQYVDAPLPLAKLDLVAVPEFFGAMENPGLVAFRADILIEGRQFVDIAAHELAHQWFGDAVTPAWWDDLWLSESFASWLAERTTAALGASRSLEVAHRDRVTGLDADDEVDARPVIHRIASSSEIEPAFDALAYDKGAAVLAMFERFVGPDAFQVAVRRYLADHGGTSVTSQALFDALAAATRPEVAAALAANLVHSGTPVVELALVCDPAAAATITASVAGGVTVPVCVRYPSARGAARSCFLAGAHTEQVLPAGSGCPAWLVGNAAGAGYYRTAWRGPATRAPVSELSPIERLVRGDDAALAARFGELPAAGALAEIAALAASRDPDAALAALQIAGELDAFADDAVRPAWTAWLARRFADRLTRAALLEIRRPANDALVAAVLLPLVRAALDPAVVAAARADLDRYADPASRVWLLRIAAARDATPLFDRLVRVAAAHDGDARDADLAAMGELPAVLAPRVVDTALDRRFSAEAVWPALAAMLGRSETRSEAWRAIHARFATLVAALGRGGGRAVLEAAAALCDQRARDELAADARDAELAATGAGSTQLAGTLATIDRCLVRRAASGDLAAALAAP